MFFSLFLVVVLSGVVLEGVKIIQLLSINRNIRMIAGENQLLKDRVDSLNEEVRLETREEVIRYQAQKNLGMIEPANAVAFAVNRNATEAASNAKE